MSHPFHAVAMVALLLALTPAHAQERMPGDTLDGLLTLAKASHPEYASMRDEALAAQARVTMAGALMDPKLRVEWMDITRGNTRSPTLWPSDTGSTRYTVMQDLPWFGKRALKAGIAAQEAQALQSRAQSTWVELSARVRAAQAQRYFLLQSNQLVRELLDLTNRLAQVAQARYAGGLAAQQDAIRALMEQTAMETERVALDLEARQADARLNALLARPAQAALAPPSALPAPPAADTLDPSALLARADLDNPLLLAEAARVQGAQLSQALAQKGRYPDFTVAVSPTQMQGRISEWSLMLEMNIALQPDVRRAQEREAQAMLNAAQNRRVALANQLGADLTENLLGLQAAQRTEQLAKNRLLPQAELSFQAALAGYENGKLDFATLLDAQRQVRAARQSQLKAQLEAQLRLAELEKLTGSSL